MYEMSRDPSDKAARTREKLERAQEKVARAEAHTEEQLQRAEERTRERMGRAQERIERAKREAGDDGEELIWLREEPRSRRPSHSRAEIARAALQIADSEGFDAVSMRRVASQLGAGTMTIYHYVRNKKELITLMVDAVMAEILVPDDELAEDWRVALTQVAIRSRDAFIAHRWTLDRLDDNYPGPNGMRHFEQSLRAVASLDLPKEHIFELIGQVDDYVFGYALRELQERDENERGWPPGVVEFLQRELDSGDYPLIRESLGGDARAGIANALELLANEGRFERGLNRLLDGFEAELGV
jgi:AcrR family transcriptional regulator